MLRRRELLVGAAALCLSRAAWAQAPALDVALVNARVWTGAGDRVDSDAVGIAGNRIAAVGAERVRAATGRGTRVIDCQGAFVCPAFIDNHTHFLRGSRVLGQPVLLDAASRDDFAALLGKAARQSPGRWILGGAWDEHRMGGRLPNRDWIDAVTRDTPVAVPRTDLHTYLLNSLALRLAGIDRDTPDPPGGAIERDAKGEPTGIIKDNAKALVDRVIPLPADADTDRTALAGIAHALSHGIAQIHVPEVDWNTHHSLRRLHQRRALQMRFYSMVPLPDWERMAAIVEDEGRGDDWLRWGGVKGLADGSLGSRTAVFHQPYTDAPAESGVRVMPLDALEAAVAGADAAGLYVSVHAIGDRANDEVLDILARVAERNGPRDRRFRIEHAQHIAPASISRFARQGVIASVQPYHAADDGRWAVDRIGPDRLRGTYAFGSLMKSGARVTFGSDWPVAPISPLVGIHAAVTRETIDGANPGGWLPEEKISPAQALAAYTRNNAFAGFQEDRLGLIAPGFLADVVMLDGDPLTVEGDAIARIAVLRTFVDGRERFTA